MSPPMPMRTLKNISWFKIIDRVVLPLLFIAQITSLLFRAWLGVPSKYLDALPWMLVFFYWGIIKRQHYIIRKLGDGKIIDFIRQVKEFEEHLKKQINEAESQGDDNT